MERPGLLGLSHVALTVGDLERSTAWYLETLGFAVLFAFDTDDFQRRILAHRSGAVVALTQHAAPLLDEFDPRRPGLDHLAFAVPSVEVLEHWAQWLTDRGVGHAGVQLTPSTGSALVAFTDPDGTALELYVQVGAAAG